MWGIDIEEFKKNPDAYLNDFLRDDEVLAIETKDRTFAIMTMEHYMKLKKSTIAKVELEKLLKLVDEMVADKDFMNKMGAMRMFFRMGLDDIDTFKDCRCSVSRAINETTERIKELEKET